jgi:hypothetical protein
VTLFAIAAVFQIRSVLGHRFCAVLSLYLAICSHEVRCSRSEEDRWQDQSKAALRPPFRSQQQLLRLPESGHFEFVGCLGNSDGLEQIMASAAICTFLDKACV